MIDILDQCGNPAVPTMDTPIWRKKKNRSLSLSKNYKYIEGTHKYGKYNEKTHRKTDIEKEIIIIFPSFLNKLVWVIKISFPYREQTFAD